MNKKKKIMTFLILSYKKSAKEQDANMYLKCMYSFGKEKKMYTFPALLRKLALDWDIKQRT